MKDLHKIGKNRTFKIIGLTVVLYLIFFSKKNPDSITNHVTVEDIKKGVQDAKEKTNFIKKNLQAAKEADKEEKPADKTKKEEVVKAEAPAPVKVEEEVKPENYGDEKYKILCGDEVEISYSMVVKKQPVGAPQHDKMIVGGNTNYFIEHGLIGLSKGNNKQIAIPSKVDQGKNGKMIFSKNSDVAYQVSILSVRKAVKPELKCY